MSEEETRVVRHDERSRYELFADGELAGFARYAERGNQTVFTHTEIDEAFGGRGLGQVLAKAALDDVVERGRVIVAVCPFIAGYLKRHPGYQDHVRRAEGTSAG
ncbi:GNAT family N-acetyltransferase [Amycolatopsis sp. PS_44_ISF1]|uniref:GNAT family N-acetyltransferase n=1 Tax=Amycolatopsis sp. PS_44_ISF1 TaxID=2974917 RepID=UPI0028DFB398|nr:GNAT family N-acetyltransferase [Amycolatopsis sp. PS_44_ISF1]MDT8915903.1 N-acetyltransferase [Amycolatopsis sp. PS_44_ISF1]